MTHTIQAIQARRTKLSIKGSLLGSVSIQHVSIFLIVLAISASSKRTKILRFTLGSLKHTYGDKDASQKYCMN